jgi:glycosyltransferase involved in cell wall biosynthesis
MLKKSTVGFSLVHAHRLDIGFTGAVLKDTYSKPLIVTCHGSDVYDFPFRDDFRYAVAKCVLSRADHVIAVCTSDAEKLLSLGLSSSKLSIIPNGFDDNLFQPIPEQSTREKLGLALNKKILLSVGILHEVKGYDYLIDAMYRISKIRNDVITVIVGSGPLEMKLRKKIEKLGLKQRVLLVGWEQHNKIPLWMNASDIFVLPSLNEGFPTVIPEVMACGKPVIGTRVGGIPDAISSDNVGILVKPRDPEALAQAILEALNQRWEHERIRGYAQKYSLKNVVKQILQVYQHVINEQE